MPKSNETTTKFKVDISELKAGIQEANRQIALANSEFKKASAGMESWAKDADGLSAKLTQLRTVTSQYETILEELKTQYAKVVAEQGENSKGATDLKIKMNALEGAIKGNNATIARYESQLASMQAGTKETTSASEKLRNTIGDQEREIEQLKQQYQDTILVQGKESDAVQVLKTKISALTSEVNANKAKLKESEYATEDLADATEDAGDEAKDAGDGFTIMKGALADLLADGIKSVIGGLKDFVKETDSAYKKFQAATGASAEEMEDFKAEMDDLYQNAYGESLEDIGDKMAYIKQVTGETDPSKIKELAENAMALEDTFGSDFNETIRGVNNLMQHFGIDSKQAFDLFAKGSQTGLDYTGELGDNIAEYGGNFQQAGYSAEEYFQLLENGSKNGAYNLDKVNDSINEVKNRLGDGTIEKNIDLFSEGTKSAFKAWKSGKGTMKDVINSIVKDINNCENEQEALTMAATAFGTMGEDANLKVVKSLTTVGNTFDNVSGSMEEMKNIRYDDVGTQFTELGRKLQSQLLKPLAERALPYFKQLGDYAIENLDKITSALTVVGGVLGTVFAVNKMATFTQSLTTLATTFGLVKTGTDAANTSTLALNASWLASPAGIATVAIAGLTAAVIYYSQKQDEAIEKEYGLSEAQQESIEKSAQLKKSYDQMSEVRKTSNANIESEYGRITELKNEYNGLIDKNGKVKKGYEDRAAFIKSELASALGLEQDELQKLIDKNGQLSDSIDDVIQKKKAEATLNANEAAYTEAIQKRSEALSTYQESLTTLEGAEKKYSETKAAADKVMENYQVLLKGNADEAYTYLMGQQKIIDANDKAKESYDKAKKGVEDAEAAYVGYNTTIQNYEGLSAAIISGDTAKIGDALKNMQNNFITAETGTRSSLEKQVKNTRQTYEDMVQAINDGTPGVTQAQVKAAAKMVEAAEKELAKLPPEAEDSGEKAGEAHADGVKGTKTTNEVAGADVSKAANKGLSSADTQGTGKKKAEEFENGAVSKKKLIEFGAVTLSNALDGGLASANTNKTGQNKAGQFNSGAEAKNGAVNGTGRNLSGALNTGLGSVNMTGTGQQKTIQFNKGAGSVGTFGTGAGRAKEAKKGFASVDAKSTGNNFTAGFKNGMGNGSAAKSIWSTAWNLGKKALNALKKSIKEGSPSKETRVSGKWFVLGFANEIADMTKVAVKAARQMGEATVNELNKVEMPTLNKGLTSSARSLNTAGRGAQSAQGQSGGVVNNFTQNNYSPKALNRLEIYRQTRNQLSAMGGS